MTELSFPGNLTDVEELAVQLSTTGLGSDACESRARLFALATKALSITGEAAGGRTPVAFFVPGRIEVLGKHTDYAGGRAMVAAVERGFCVVALPRDDRQMVVIDAATGETVVFPAGAEIDPQTGTWSNTPMTVVRRVARNFLGAVRGADIAFLSDLTPDAGMGGSSALLAGVFLALAEVNQLASRDEYWHNIGNKVDLAGYLGAIESGQAFGTLEGDPDAGAFGGGEDLTAILCAESNNISQYSFRPVEFEKMFTVPPGYVFAVGTSGVAVEENRDTPLRLAAALLDLWRRETGRDDPHLAAALGSSPGAAERLAAIARTATGGEFSSEALLARLEHFIAESGEIIPSAGDALEGGDLRAFGRLVDRSQRGAEQLLKNQVPETVFLAASARKLGAAAASSFGFGFGGGVWALVEEGLADDFLADWLEAYSAEFPSHVKRACFFATGAGPAAFRVC